MSEVFSSAAEEVELMRKRLHRVICRYYGKDRLAEILGLLQAGWRGAPDEIMRENDAFERLVNERLPDLYPNMPLRRDPGGGPGT